MQGTSDIVKTGGQREDNETQGGISTGMGDG